jgi:hypothetical protein
MSQHGIDQFILSIFNGKKGIFIEAGSSHPTDQNNTYLLEQNGWTGMLVEPRSHHNNEYKILRPKSIVENYALVDRFYDKDTVDVFPHQWGHMWSIGNIFKNDTSDIQTWPAITLEKLLKKHSFREIDFFSLDTEGYEHEILNGIDFDYTTFNTILIETHDYSWNNKTNNFDYLEKFGYRHFINLSQNHQLWIHKKVNLKSDQSKTIILE